jgi:hypothetical protein
MGVIKILLEGDDFSNKMNTVEIPKSLCPQLPHVCQDHVATGVLLILGANDTCKHSFYTRIAAESTRMLSAQQGQSYHI